MPRDRGEREREKGRERERNASPSGGTRDTTREERMGGRDAGASLNNCPLVTVRSSEADYLRGKRRAKIEISYL